MGGTNDTSAAALTETRWRKYGKDRVYLRTAAGDEAGYVDLITREAVIVDPAHGDAVRACLERSLKAPDAPDAPARDLPPPPHLQPLLPHRP